MDDKALKDPNLGAVSRAENLRECQDMLQSDPETEYAVYDALSRDCSKIQASKSP